MNKYDIWYQNVTDQDKKILDTYHEEDKKLYFSHDLEYGTAGIRAKMMLGSSTLNIYNIKKMALGLVNFINKYYPGSSVVVGHDYRNNSKEFSNTFIGILNNYGIKTCSFKDAVPTPFVSYIVKKYPNTIGINITASHNPKEYNGIKFYGNDGAQLDDHPSIMLSEEINNITDFFNQVAEINELNKVIDDAEYQKYSDYVLTTGVVSNPDFSNIKITYTPQHGVGSVFAEQLFDTLKVNYNVVTEQMIPDGNFSQTTVANPEDIRAFDKAIEYANAIDSDIVISHDPDADRMGMMIKTNQGYQLLSGNQVGVLMLDYLINNTDINNSYVVKTVVTTPLIDQMCQKHNIKCFNTLTGFKNLATCVKPENGKLLLAFEESIGYLLKDAVRDKDAFQATVIMTEITSQLKRNHQTIEDKLEAIYREYGYYQETTINVYDDSVEGTKNIADIVEKYRNYADQAIGGQTIVEKQDYLNMPGYPASNFIKFVLSNGFVIIRPSGTEPKLKYYFSICNRNLIAAKEQLKILKETIVK